MNEFTEIPIVDVSAIRDGDDADIVSLSKAFFDAYNGTGFGYIVNHGIDDALVERVFAASARFHGLPREQKLAVELNELHRGFIPINTSTDVNSKLADVKKPNQSESFMVMREDGPGASEYLAGPNQWPELDGFREDVTAYHDAMAILGKKLMNVAMLSIGVDLAKIAPAFQRPTTWLRLLYYPPAAPLDEDDLYGSAPHTDFGCLTLLAQDDIGGLQVQTPGGDWVDAPRIPGSFVVNVGDMLHRWSNGRLRSTPHRVINRSGKARFSCPFFYDPHVSTDIVPFDECIAEGETALFPPLNFGEFLRGELEAGYEKHKKG